MRVMWDLYCGLGGASAAFADAGWRVIRVDNNPLFKPDILCDISKLDARDVEPPDFVWASPPCVEFALRRFDPSINPSLELVKHARRVIDELRPKYWCIENVRHAVPFIDRVLGKHRLTAGPFFLWGNFPLFLPSPVSGKGSPRGPHWLRSAMRAKIPYALSSDMEKAVTYVLTAPSEPSRRRALEPASGPAAAAKIRPAQEPARCPPSSPPVDRADVSASRPAMGNA